MSEEMMANKTTQVLVGCDPEFFLKTVKGNHNVGAYDRIGGTKDKPNIVHDMNANHKLSRWPGDFAYQEDGAAFEFNVPASHSWEHAANITRQMLRWSANFLLAKGYKPNFASGVKFPDTELRNPKAKIIGCSADWDAYEERARRPFSVDEFGNWRFAGGHLHLSYDKSKVPAHIMTQFLDVMLGLPSIFVDKQGERRKFYGKAGLYREKSYGIEYRTLSNFWLRDFESNNYFTPVYGAMFDLGITGTTRPDVLIDAYGRIPWDDVRDAINNEDEKLAGDIINFLVNKTKIPMRFGCDLMNIEQRKAGRSEYKRKFAVPPLEDFITDAPMAIPSNE